MKKFLFYTYRTSDGANVIIEIEADSRKSAIAEFDFLYGEDTPIDLIVER